jgi:DNA-binding HxlR family transcriptional regulator
MSRTSLAEFNCSLARTADLIGDKWTLLILRDAFYGFSKFADFKQRLGITQTVLSARLQGLVEAGILERVQEKAEVERYRYKLTQAGADLLPVIVAIVQWGDRWVFGETGPPVILKSRKSGRQIQAIEIRDNAKNAVQLRDLAFSPGPGASEETLKAFEEALQRRKSRS